MVLLLTLTTQAQQYIGYTQDSIEYKLNELHGKNIQGKGHYDVYGGKALVYDIYIPSIKQNITAIYNINKHGICFQYLRLADYLGYSDTYEYMSAVTQKIDDTHFIDEANIIWTFHINSSSDYFTLIAEKN